MDNKKRFGWRDVPKCCDNCGHTDIKLTNNDVIYGKVHGKWPKIWYCKACGAAVSCHPESKYPMGKMADRETRAARGRAHKHFDQIFNHYRIMGRSSAYTWLASAMGIPRNKCHISYFSADQCGLVVKLSKAKIKQHKKKPATVTHRNGRPVSKRGHRRKFK